jgi:PAS domain S-box-containing protein
MNPSFQDEFPYLERAELEVLVAESHREQILDSFFTAASSVSAGLCVYDAQLRYVRVNAALAEMNGLPVAVHLGKTIREVLPNLSSTLEPLCRQVLEARKPIFNVEISGETPAQPGVKRHWMASFFPVRVQQNWGVGMIALENTARQQIEDVLRASETRFKALVQSSYDIIALTDDQSHTVIQSPSALQQILGYSSVSSASFFGSLHKVHPSDRLKVQAALDEILANPDLPVMLEYRVQRANGTWAWLESIGTNRLADPDINAIVTNTRDVSGRKQAEEALRQQVERERLIARISLRIRQSLDLLDILNAVVAEVRQFLQADRVVINCCHDMPASPKHLTLAESVGEGWESSLGWSIQDPWLEERLHLYNQGTREAIDDMQAIPLTAATQAWVDTLRIKSRLAMPIVLGDKLWGVLAVHHCATPRHWEPFEVELLEQIATHLAIAIQQAELHQEIQRLNDHLETEVQARTAQLKLAFDFEATLKRITDRVRDSLDEDQILQAVVREVAMVMKVKGCNASLYDLEQGTSTTCYEYTNSISPYQGRVSKFSAVPELYSQLLQGQYFQFCSLVPNPERGLSAMLACPIRDDQGVIGDLWLIHHKHHAFNEQDIRLVQQVANQCAIAIRQARLYEESQTQVKELERLNQLKDDFLSTVSHELRTPLSNIKMAIHMLRTAPTSEKRERYLEILEAECSRETELINDLLDLQRLENDSYTISPEPINLKEWLPGIMAPFLSRAQSRQQHLRIDLPNEMPMLLSDRKSLERILAELLNNACKYTCPDGEIILSVNFHQTDLGIPIDGLSMTRFVVKNQADVPVAELPRMFEKFYRIPKSDPWQQGGTGLGLALVKRLVETLQGAIEVDSSDGWTTLVVQLPMLMGRC